MVSEEAFRRALDMRDRAINMYWKRVMKAEREIARLRKSLREIGTTQANEALDASYKRTGARRG